MKSRVRVKLLTVFLILFTTFVVLITIPLLLRPYPNTVHVNLDEMDTTQLQLRVMSYNIHHGVGMDGELDLERISDVIVESGADIIGLQEVDNQFSSRSEWKDQAQWLADKLEMHVAYGANLNYPPNANSPRGAQRQYGTAVLSKYPIEASQNYPLTSYGHEQRGLLETVIDLEGTQLYFYTTHLGLTKEQRITQAQEVLEITSRNKGPKIIAGDLNGRPLSREMKPLLSAYWDAFANKWLANTVYSNFPYKRIDYILAQADQVKFDAQHIIRTTVSDHLPIIADVELTVLIDELEKQ